MSYLDVGEPPAGCMKRPGGWLWKLRFCRGSHPRTAVKNEPGTHEFPSSSVGTTCYWGKGQQVKKKNLLSYLVWSITPLFGPLQQIPILNFLIRISELVNH